MTNPWGDDLRDYRKKKRQKFNLYLNKGVRVNPKAYCCDDPEAVTAAKPPVAIFTASPNPVYEGDTVTLSLNSSYDPNGGALASYEIWDGQPPNGVHYWLNPAGNDEAVVYPTAGRYEAYGVVEDATGLRGQASTWVEVFDPVDPPPPPPGPDPEGVGKKLIAATNPYGIAVCLDRFATPPVWTALNGNLAGANLQIVDLIIDPWNTDRALICTASGDVFENTAIWDGGSWSPIYDASVEGPGDHANKVVRIRKGIKDDQFIVLALEALSGFNQPLLYIIHSHTDGGAWPTSVLLANANVPFWPNNCLMADTADAEKGGNVVISSHDPDVVFAAGLAGSGIANQVRPSVWKSIDKAHTFPLLIDEVETAGGGNSDAPTVIKVPFYDNPTDQKILIGCWYILGGPKIGPYYVEDGLANVPVAADEFSGFPAGHTLVDNFYPPRGSHGIATWEGDHIKLFTQTAGPNYHVILSDDWGATFLVRAIVDPAPAVFEMLSCTTWPYDPNLFVIGRAASASVYMILMTDNAGVSFGDLTGNLRTALSAGVNAMRITQIVFDWLS